MIKYILFFLALFLFSGCFNKSGISLKYYSDCKEYYDLQGYYHKECGKDNIITYEEIRTKTGEVVNAVVGKEEKEKEEPKGNVW